jgi:hypothetical protein
MFLAFGKGREWLVQYCERIIGEEYQASAARRSGDGN